MRQTLTPDQISKEALQKIESYHAIAVEEGKSAIQQNKVVVVGMAHNVFVRKARKLLDSKSIPFKYVEYGSYFSQWKPRLAVKLWSGWPTFPQVFVNGQLIGGYSDLNKLMQDGAIKV